MSYALSPEMIVALEAAAHEVRAGNFRERGEAARGVNPFGVVSVWKADDIPAGAMPAWLAHVLFAVGEHIEREDWAHLYQHLAWAGARWSVLDDAARERLRRDFAVQALEHMLAFAAPLQPDPPPGYWREIAPHVQAAICALRDNDDVADAGAALWCWTVSEGSDLWQQENASYEAMSAAHSLASAAYGLDDDGGHTMGGLVQDAVFTGNWVGTAHFLLRTLLQRLASEISMATWA